MYQTAYPNLRASLAPEYLELSDEQLDFLVAEIYGAGVAAEDVEAFWSDVGRGFKRVGSSIGNFAQSAAPVLGRALPAIAQGAMTGATVGGPFGAIAGAVAGGAGGVLAQSRNPTLRGIGGAIGGVSQLASNFTGGGALRNLAGVALGGGRGGAAGLLGNLAGSALGGGRGGAAGLLGSIAGSALGRRRGPGGALGGIAQTALGALQQRGGPAAALGQLAGGLAPQLAAAVGQGGSANALLGLLSRPETVRALSAAAMGPYGRAQVPVGQHAVPVQSILGAVGNLAGHAASEAEAAGGRHPGYFYAADGELAIDPADAEQRTAALLELFEQTPSPYLVQQLQAEADESYEADEADEAEYGDEDAIYDEWLLANEAEWSESGEDQEYDDA